MQESLYPDRSSAAYRRRVCRGIDGLPCPNQVDHDMFILIVHVAMSMSIHKPSKLIREGHQLLGVGSHRTCHTGSVLVEMFRS